MQQDQSKTIQPLSTINSTAQAASPQGDPHAHTKDIYSSHHEVKKDTAPCCLLKLCRCCPGTQYGSRCLTTPNPISSPPPRASSQDTSNRLKYPPPDTHHHCAIQWKRHPQQPRRAATVQSPFQRALQHTSSKLLIITRRSSAMWLCTGAMVSQYLHNKEHASDLVIHVA